MKKVRLALLACCYVLPLCVVASPKEETYKAAPSKQAPARPGAPAPGAHPGVAGPRGFDPHPGGAGFGPSHPGFEHPADRHMFVGHDFHHFGPHDQELWRAGAWHHELHDGRWGWWWFAGGAWYFYDQPVYPYPMAVSEVVYAEPVTVVEQAVQPAPPPPPVIAPAPQFRYYCESPAGYYPQVASCPTSFRKVPVQ